MIAGPEADAQVMNWCVSSWVLDQPLYHQFWHYISNAVQGDFGLSMVSRRPVADEIASRFMPTLWLTITSMVWAVIFGMAAVVAAYSIMVRRIDQYDHCGVGDLVSGICAGDAFNSGILR
ncbi:hypothetical protein ACLB1M_08820 [Escherichia coli]